MQAAPVVVPLDEFCPASCSCLDLAVPVRVVEKKEILEGVWPDTFVKEVSLARHVSLLRTTSRESKPFRGQATDIDWYFEQPSGMILAAPHMKRRRGHKKRI